MNLADGRSLFDLFGREFTLIDFAGDARGSSIVDAALKCGLPLHHLIVSDGHARAIYERDLVLIRPDQHVAWRSDSPPVEIGQILDIVRGQGPSGTARIMR